MPDQPIVSVAIPVYNGERYLREAIESVLSQDYPVTELKVYDNASSDDSASIAGSLVGAANVVVSAVNVGAAANFARGLAMARPDAEYFAWCAADDRLAPSFISRCVRALRDAPEAPACLTGIRFIDPSGATLRVHSDQALGSRDPRTRLRAFLRRPRWTEFYCLYRRQSLLDSPGVTSAFGSDVHLTWWFLLQGPLAVITDPLLEYREFPVKTSAEMSESLDPGSAAPLWTKVALWRHLWSMTRATPSGRIGRQELLLALVHPTWWLHLAEDVFTRWPRLGRFALLVARQALRLRPAAPEGRRPSPG